MSMKMKKLCWIQNIVIEDSKGHIIVDKRRVMKIWENYITEL
jgi:hypothetical protein